MPNHGSTVPLLKFQIAPRLTTFNILWQKESKFYYLSISLVNEPTARFHNEAPIGTLVSFQSLFYISLGFLNKQGLNETKPHLYLPVKGKERPIPVPPKGLL